MLDAQQNADSQAVLRERLNRFLGNHARWKQSLRGVLDCIGGHDWPAVVFGGVLRDLVAFGIPERPRDIDIVVDHVSRSELVKALSAYPHRETRFGGLRLTIDQWLIDVWPLSDTWAFKEYGLAYRGLGDLPKTTFLNVEAIAADICVEKGRERSIYVSGFFEAVRTRLLDINFEPNPYPSLCVIRALITAARLDFRITRSLASYITREASNISLDALVQIQINHYGNARLRPQELLRWLNSIEGQLQDNRLSSIGLPINKAEQMQLFEEPVPR